MTTRSEARSATPFRILFVCTGNTCRSPLAEVLARKAIEARGWSQAEVGSAGVAAWPGAPASVGSVRAARTRGLDLTAHQSRPLSPELLEWADLVVAMSASHLAAIRATGEGAKATLLSSAATGGKSEADVSDPFGGDDEEYLATCAHLEELIEGLLQRLEPVIAP